MVRKITKENKMMGSINLIVAKYENEIITYSDYNKSVHHGKIFCPSCNPPLRVTDSGKGYFMAWKNEGGHNCGLGEVKYFDADWIGRKLVESIKVDKQLEVNIDVDLLFRKSITGNPSTKSNIDKVNNEEKTYYTYQEKKEIFRDVIRSVLQMKRIIEQNPYEKLQNINFYFKVGGEERLKIEEAVINSSELNLSKHKFKYRFILFKVDNIVKKNDKIFVNAYKANGNSLSVTINLYNRDIKINLRKDSYAIVFGKITFSPKLNKYFIEITNDFQIKEIDKNKIVGWFEKVNLEKFNYEEIKIEENVKNNLFADKKIEIDNKIFEIKSNDELKEKVISNQSYINQSASSISNERIINYRVQEEIDTAGKIIEDEDSKIKFSRKNNIIKKLFDRFSKK